MTSPQAKTGVEVERLIGEIQKALDAQPTPWDYDSNQTPFYNDADGHSRGGDNDGTYCLYGPDFFIDGERYEGPVLAERCAKKDAHYIAACNPENMRVLLSAISAHEAEVGRLREALEEIALAGMSPSPEMSQNGVETWHARQAWRFIGIAARAISPVATTGKGIIE